MKIPFLINLKNYFLSLIQKKGNKVEIKNFGDSYQCSISIPNDKYEPWLSDLINYCPDCRAYRYNCKGNYFWPCFAVKEKVLSKLSKEDRKEIENIENDEELSKRYRMKLIDDYLFKTQLDTFLKSDF